MCDLTVLSERNSSPAISRLVSSVGSSSSTRNSAGDGHDPNAGSGELCCADGSAVEVNVARRSRGGRELSRGVVGRRGGPDMVDQRVRQRGTSIADLGLGVGVQRPRDPVGPFGRPELRDERVDCPTRPCQFASDTLERVVQTLEGRRVAFVNRRRDQRSRRNAPGSIRNRHRRPASAGNLIGHRDLGTDRFSGRRVALLTRRRDQRGRRNAPRSIRNSYRRPARARRLIGHHDSGRDTGQSRSSDQSRGLACGSRDGGSGSDAAPEAYAREPRSPK